MNDAVDARLPWIRKVHDLDDAWATEPSGRRLAAVRLSAEGLGDEFRAGPRVAAVRTLPLRTLPYPTRHAFNGACLVPVPYVSMVHRSLLIQVETPEGRKNILFNPSDTEAAKETPFFKRLVPQYGAELAEKMLSAFHGTVEAQLAKHDLRPEDIDVIAFDHFHTQDLRPQLGTIAPNEHGEQLPARFPNAYLLAPKNEWNDWDNLHPFQRTWFIKDGKKDVNTERVILTEHDLALGEGCLLLRTPGHTSGNQTIFVHTEAGVFGCSENGTSADSWSPYESRIPGLRGYVRHYDLEVVLNSNTPEFAATQYTSMLLERSIVDRAEDNPAFFQMFPSSEVTPWRFAPGIQPSMIFGEIRSGQVEAPRSTPIAEAAE
ncbi:MAG: hypothetical protein AAGF12_15235 [Myxococcota bacterium]